jgi:hypothetical protein
VPHSILDQRGDFSNTNNPLVTFGRADYIVSLKNTINLQYAYSVLNGGNKGPSSQTTSASSNNKYLDRSSRGVKAALTTVVSPSVLNEVRGQYAYDNRNEDSVLAKPQVDITGFGTLGGNSDGHLFYYAKRYEILDNLNWKRGILSFKFGVDLNSNPAVGDHRDRYLHHAHRPALEGGRGQGHAERRKHRQRPAGAQRPRDSAQLVPPARISGFRRAPAEVVCAP